MKALLLSGIAVLAMSAPATAQTMDHSNMPGMKMSAPKPAAAKPAMPAKKRVAAKPQTKRAPAKAPATRRRPTRAVDAHADHDMQSMPGMDMSGDKPADARAGHDMFGMQNMQTKAPQVQGGDPHAAHDMSPMSGASMPAGQPMQHDMATMPGMSQVPAGTDLKPGNAPAPAPQPGLAASRYWGAEAMANADRELRQEHGGMTYYQVLFNLAEYQARRGRDGYRWDGEASVGGDINRLWLKSEGEGTFGDAIEQLEVQALYSRAIDPYWNLQGGIRQDFKPGPSRTYATLSIEGLAPYWFEVEAALFLSEKGDVSARTETYYDQRITQNFVLQPRLEANFSAQDVRENDIGPGLTDLELGLRLRYEKSREFAPYIGISWERKFGETARLARAGGGDTGGINVVAGVRTWF
jgi:copper resistance protein B